MHKEIICINCPIGCHLDIELDDQGNFISVSGNLCPKGKEYAIKEMTAPVGYYRSHHKKSTDQDR